MVSEGTKRRSVCFFFSCWYAEAVKHTQIQYVHRRSVKSYLQVLSEWGFFWGWTELQQNDYFWTPSACFWNILLSWVGIQFENSGLKRKSSTEFILNDLFAIHLQMYRETIEESFQWGRIKGCFLVNCFVFCGILVYSEMNIVWVVFWNSRQGRLIFSISQRMIFIFN